MAPEVPGRTPFILGLTGPIACGKSTVGDLLLELGALERIDADRVVHELLGSNTPVAQSIRRRFGPEVALPNDGIDRARLAATVFSDPEALEALERITHPAVREAIRARLAELQGQSGVVVVDAVKLLQSDLLNLMDAVWVVQCAPELQLVRLTGTRGMSEESARARLAAQPSFEHPRVSTIIENSGSLEDLKGQVRGAWAKLTSPVE